MVSRWADLHLDETAVPYDYDSKYIYLLYHNPKPRPIHPWLWPSDKQLHCRTATTNHKSVGSYNQLQVHLPTFTWNSQVPVVLKALGLSINGKLSYIINFLKCSLIVLYLSLSFSSFCHRCSVSHYILYLYTVKKFVAETGALSEMDFWYGIPSVSLRQIKPISMSYPNIVRIDYKLCLLVHKSSRGQAPEYISNMLKPAGNDPSLTMLRAASNGNYVVPRTNRRLGDKSIFCCCSQSLEQSTHRPQDRYLLDGRFQMTLEDLALQMGLIWLTYRLVMLISNFSKIRISKVRIRSKSGYRISSELHDKC